MRFEILKELEESDPKLEIPWASQDDPALRYQDLKAQPELIGSVEEVREFPALGDVLRTVNAPDSTFRSVKCGVGSTHELTQEELADVGAAHKVGTYLDLIFDVPGFNFELEPYLRLGEELDRILRNLPVPATTEFVIRRCLYHPDQAWGYSATLFLNAYGPTPREATQAGKSVLVALASALRATSKILRGLADRTP